MFKLQRFLAIANLVAILLAATIITTTYYQLETKQGIAVGEHGNIAFSKLLQNSLKGLYTPLLKPAEDTTNADRQVRIDTLLAAIERQIAGTSVLKVKLFDLQGNVVFSTHIDEIGSVSREDHYKRALQESVFTKAKTLSPGNKFGTDVEEILETYIPIIPGPEDQPIGVFEIYSDITTFMFHMQRDMLVLVSLQVLIMIGLYGVLFIIGRKADHTIQLQEAQRNLYLQQIEEANSKLELRVNERTAELLKANQELQREMRRHARADARGRKFAQAVEQAPMSVVMTNANGEIEYVNPRFCEVTGFSTDEVLGKTPKVINSGKMDTQVFKRLWTTIAAGRDWQGEMLNKKKSGELFWESQSISPIKNERGDITHFIAVKEDITTRKQNEAQLVKLATHDTLTNLPNRNLLQDRIDQAINLAHRDGARVAVMFVDLDHFKLVNDNLGHSTGDELLKEVARRLTLAVRDCDTVARQSGDEFVVVLTELYDRSIVQTVVERIIDSFQRPFEINEHHLDVTCSIGVGLYPDHGTDVETLFRHADIAMYQAKEAGRNTYAMYERTMGLALSAKSRLKQDLKSALAEQQFRLHYQPQIDISSGKVTGAEALIRWQHPELGLVPPFKFIGIAEESDSILEIGEWVIRQACRDCANWRAQGHQSVRVAINLSMRQLQRQDLVALIRDALAESGLDGDALELEITESMLMTNPQEVIALLDRLKTLGITLSIDDFGTGYSSLAYLKRLPIDRVKIDRTFVQNIPNDQDDAAIARATISMSHDLRCQVVAEGVETQQQLRYLRDGGCDAMQGYYFSHPLPIADLHLLLDRGDEIDPETLLRLPASFAEEACGNTASTTMPV